MGELMSGVKQNQNLCKLTEDCLHKMLAPGQLGHHLQRQIFYTIVAKKMGCESQVNDYLVARSNFKNVEQVQHVFCTNAYYELEDATVNHGLTDEYRDLFLETEFICPSIGYFQFMSGGWLNAIISWQSDEGCFPKSPKKPVTSTAAVVAANIFGNGPHPPAGAVQQEHPNIPAPPNFQQQREQPLLPQENTHPNDTADLPEEEAPQYVTLASPNMVLNAAVVHSPAVKRFRPVYSQTIVPLNNNFQIPLNQQLEQQQQHYDVPFVIPHQVQNQHYGNIHGYQDHDMQVENYQQAPSNQFAEAQQAQQVPQPLYAWNNDVAYAPYENQHNDPHNIPQVVPHHKLQYEMRPQQAQPRHYASPNQYVQNVQPQRQHQQQVGVGVNPYLREYHLNRGLKSVNLMAANHMTEPQKPMRERVIAGGCLSHFTSMASAALSFYLRYLVDPGPPEFLHLRLENYFRHKAAMKTKAAHRVEVSNTEAHLHVKVNPVSTSGNAMPPQMGVLKEPPGYPPIAGEQNPEPNIHSHHSSFGVGTKAEQNQAKINDMMSHAWNIMGTYNRYYGGKFHQPIYAGHNANEGVGMVPDYVHKAEVNKVLPDWTVALKDKQKMSEAPQTLMPKAKDKAPATKDDGTLSTAAAWVRHKDVNQRKGPLQGRKKSVWQQIASPKESNVKERQMEVHIIEIQSPFQRDLDHYFIAVTLVSVICLFVLFRYFRQRRNVIRNKARHF